MAASLICCLGTKPVEEWTEAEVEAKLSPKKHKNTKKTPKETKSGKTEMGNNDAGDPEKADENQSLNINIHPWDSTVNLSVHQPLYPPGKILHVVRYYPRSMAFDEK